MTAFDKLCHMLDERGARYFRQEREGKGTLAKVAWVYPTGPDSSDVFIATIVRYGDHLLFRGYLTPEQAIAATLGTGTCHDKGNIERFICSECGCRLDLQDDDWEATMWLDGAAMVPNFCPNCGRKVVDA